MNTFDKSSLYEMSYAFMRRFAFIMVDSPDEVDAGPGRAVRRCVEVRKDEQRCEQVAALWNLVNSHRKIGPALFRDIYQFSRGRLPEAEMDSAIALFLFPQFEGLLEEQQKKFVERTGLSAVHCDPKGLKHRAATFFHINAWGLCLR